MKRSNWWQDGYFGFNDILDIACILSLIAVVVVILAVMGDWVG